MKLYCLCGSPLQYIFVDNGNGLELPEPNGNDEQVMTLSPNMPLGVLGCSNEECPDQTTVAILQEGD